MKNNKSIIWGIILVMVGVIYGLNSLNIVDINLFFPGWWTLFIIVPCVIGLVTDGDKTGSIIGVIIGVLLLIIPVIYTGYMFYKRERKVS